MYNTNKVRLSICGSDYVINTTEAPEYVKQLAYEIEEICQEMLDSNNSATLVEAYMLCCLSYADKFKKSELNSDHLRSQLTEYLEDAARTRIELEEAKREIDRLNRELVLK